MTLEMMKEATFDTGKIPINYAEGPNTGPPLVLLHGLSDRWQDMAPLIPGLSAQWHVFAIDLRGHGKSGRLAGGYAIRDYADDVQIFLQVVSGPAVVFGHSMGGMVALMAASQRSELFRAVVAGDSPLDKLSFKKVMDAAHDMARQWQSLAGGARPVAEITAVVKDELLADKLFHHDPAVLAMLLDDFDRAVTGYELDNFMPAVRCPVLLLQADPSAGGLMSDPEVERARALLGRSSHASLPGRSHWFFRENPEQALEAMDPFLSRIL